MGLFNFRPARPKKYEPDGDVRIVTDLDRLVSDPVGFMLFGKVHYIKPMTTENFLRVTNELTRVDALRRSEKAPPQEELMGVYISIFASVCDTIGKKEVYDMTQSQIGALFQTIINCVTGAVHESTQKKTLTETENPTKTG